MIQVSWIMGQGATISGFVQRANNAPIENVEVFLIGMNGDLTISDTVFTNNEGFYRFLDVPVGSTIDIIPSKNGETCWDNCINNGDALLIQQEIRVPNSFTSPYQYIAADVDRSGSLTNIDILLLRQVLLGNRSTFNNNTCWRFVPADFGFEGGPLMTNFPEQATIDNVGDNQQVDFIGVQTGDVNNCERLFGAGALEMIMPDFNIPCDVLPRTISVPLTINGFDNLLGYQFSLNWIAGNLGLDYVNITSFNSTLGITINNFGVGNTAAGNLTFSWIDQSLSGVSLADGSVIAIVEFTVNQAGTISISDAPILTEGQDVNFQSVSVTRDPADITVDSMFCNTTPPNCIVSSNSPLCPGDTLKLMETGGDAVSWSWVGPNGFSSTDQNPTIPNASGPNDGTYTVTATDGNGNSYTCSTTVVIEDLNPPTAICNTSINVSLNANGIAIISPTDIDNGSSDDCGIDTMYISQDTFDCDDIGMINLVILTVIDESQNISTCTTEVTIDDRNNSCLEEIKFILPDISVSCDQQVCIPVTIANFSNIANLQFSINYDDLALDFASATFNSALSANAQVNSNLTGALAIVINNSSGLGVTLADGDVLATLCFNILTTTAQNTSVVFSDNPTAREVSTPNSTETFASMDGSINLPNCPNCEPEIICPRDTLVEACPSNFDLNNLPGPEIVESCESDVKLFPKALIP